MTSEQVSLAALLPCGFCGAEMGQMCLEDGARVDHLHQDRQDAAGSIMEYIGKGLIAGLACADLASERIEYETRLLPFYCRCGHPGSGCYCSSKYERTGRYRVRRTYKETFTNWIDPSIRDGDDSPKRALMTEPHDGHGDNETCPGCPHFQGGDDS